MVKEEVEEGVLVLRAHGISDSHELSPWLPPLPKLSFSPECTASFAEWRLRTDHRLAELRCLVTVSKVRVRC